jgi:hypothetical protein
VAFAEKLMTGAGTVTVAGRHLKRYELRGPGLEIEDDVKKAADAFVARLLPGTEDDTPPAGFTVLHRNSQGAFLDAFSWVWGDVVEARTAAAGVPLLGCENEDPANFKALARPWIGCVWELAPLEHERAAWVRHVLQPDIPDLSGYLADRFPDGFTGGPR